MYRSERRRSMRSRPADPHRLAIIVMTCRTKCWTNPVPGLTIQAQREEDSVQVFLPRLSESFTVTLAARQRQRL